MRNGSIRSSLHATPPLTPQPDFLRLSRSTVDDSIAQNLNALITPSRAGFDPSSTSQRVPRAASRLVDGRACAGFRDRILFPSWQSRSDVLAYCALVATSPDPDDPSLALREAESERDRERVVDERLDPYSARFFPREARTQQLAGLVRQERAVENIVRTRTWEAVRQRCGEPVEQWETAMNQWRGARESL